MDFLNVWCYVPPFLSDLVILVFYLHLLVSFDRGLYLVDFLKETSLCLIVSLYWSLCFFFIDFSPKLDFPPLVWLFFHAVYSYSVHLFIFFSRFFRCAVNSLVWEFSNFFMHAFSGKTFPLNSNFIVSSQFGYIVYSFSLNFRNYLTSCFQ